MKTTDKKLVIGCVADDFTGASDAASFIANNGIKTVLTNGIPDTDACIREDVQAVVIALKSRTQTTALAIRDSLAGFDWLKAHGANILYFKYCSTFDSKPTGNIGPVIDAVLEKYNFQYTVLCPALLENKRTVKGGTLYVDGVPLAETHMRQHPLTPMWASRIDELMRPQGKYPCYNFPDALLGDKAACKKELEKYLATKKHFYICPDYYQAQQGEEIVSAFSGLSFYTGGSGLLGVIARQISRMATGIVQALKPKAGPSLPRGRILLAGSCSKATIRQVKNYLETKSKGFMLLPEKLLEGSQSVEQTWKFVEQNRNEDILIYSSGSIGKLPAGPKVDERNAEILEQTLADLAVRAVKNGWQRVIVAGGETSGAVTQALKYKSFYVGKSVAPGVPILMPTDYPDLRLVLKSGNFGGDDFFNTTLQN